MKKILVFLLMVSVFPKLSLADYREDLENYARAKKIKAMGKGFRASREARFQQERETELFELQKSAALIKIKQLQQSPNGSEDPSSTLDDMQRMIDKDKIEQAMKEQTDSIKELARQNAEAHNKGIHCTTTGFDALGMAYTDCD